MTFSNIARPLTDLMPTTQWKQKLKKTKKEQQQTAQCNWNDDQEKAYQNLKNHLPGHITHLMFS